MKAKYVMTDKGPILFPESFRHEEFRRFYPISAGFVSIPDCGHAQTFGASVSLHMGIYPGDDSLIERAFDILPF